MIMLSVFLFFVVCDLEFCGAMIDSRKKKKKNEVIMETWISSIGMNKVCFYYILIYSEEQIISLEIVGFP